ncbi:hypothetical protein B0H11DRAFT_2229605 [Mycena galericulata]|nr:hypothetical protein B0H11DRAFT_2229605 [Mycena galericulata]
MTPGGAEAFILNAATPLSTRLRTALCLYRTITASSTADGRRLLTLLLRLVPFLSPRLAAHLWNPDFGLGVDEAAARLAAYPADKGVLSVLEEGVVRERLRTVSARAFSETVFYGEDGSEHGRTGARSQTHQPSVSTCIVQVAHAFPRSAVSSRSGDPETIVANLRTTIPPCALKVDWMAVRCRLPRAAPNIPAPVAASLTHIIHSGSVLVPSPAPPHPTSPRRRHHPSPSRRPRAVATLPRERQQPYRLPPSRGHPDAHVRPSTLDSALSVLAAGRCPSRAPPRPSPVRRRRKRQGQELCHAGHAPAREGPPCRCPRALLLNAPVRERVKAESAAASGNGGTANADALDELSRPEALKRRTAGTSERAAKLLVRMTGPTDIPHPAASPCTVTVAGSSAFFQTPLPTPHVAVSRLCGAAHVPRARIRAPCCVCSRTARASAGWAMSLIDTPPGLCTPPAALSALVQLAAAAFRDGQQISLDPRSPKMRSIPGLRSPSALVPLAAAAFGGHPWL